MEEWFTWRNDLGDGSFYEKSLPLSLWRVACEKFWGQNFYKGGRNVIPVKKKLLRVNL